MFLIYIYTKITIAQGENFVVPVLSVEFGLFLYLLLLMHTIHNCFPSMMKITLNDDNNNQTFILYTYLLLE